MHLHALHLLEFRASQKQSVKFLTHYAGSRSPRSSQKTTPPPSIKVLADDSQDLAEVDISRPCQAKLTGLSEFLTNNGKQHPFLVEKVLQSERSLPYPRLTVRYLDSKLLHFWQQTDIQGGEKSPGNCDV